MKKIYFIISLFLLSKLLLSQQYPTVSISVPSELITSTTANVNVSYYLPIPGYSEVYATGVVWASSNNASRLKFKIDGDGLATVSDVFSSNPNFLEHVINVMELSNFTNPNQWMKFIGGKTSVGHTIVIGDGGPATTNSNVATEIFEPGETYYARAFVYAKVCTTYATGGCTSDRIKDVWYSNIVQINIPSSSPISNNVLTSKDQTICSGNSISAINASLPKGGNGSFSYQWQSKTDATDWTNISGANGSTYTPVAPANLNALTSVWYRRVVGSGSFTNNSNPVLYTFLPPNQAINISISRFPNSDKNALEMKAVVSPNEINIENVIWQESNSETGNFTNCTINGNNVTTLSMLKSANENKFYKVITNMAQGCPGAESKVVSLTPADGDGNKYLYTKIGTQYWMIENLRTTTYNDNTTITKITDNPTWKNSTTAGYCWYSNDSAANSFMYGSLYNLYIDTTKICPVGWGVPSKSDWETLIGNVPSGQPVLNNLAINDQSYWDPDNNAVVNSLNFNLIPSGNRGTTGTFSGINSSANYWTRSKESASSERMYNYGFTYNAVTKKYTWGSGYASPLFGMSIKCKKK